LMGESLPIVAGRRNDATDSSNRADGSSSRRARKQLSVSGTPARTGNP
jgi:hypothetical protein